MIIVQLIGFWFIGHCLIAGIESLFNIKLFESTEYDNF